MASEEVDRIRYPFGFSFLLAHALRLHFWTALILEALINGIYTYIHERDSEALGHIGVHCIAFVHSISINKQSRLQEYHQLIVSQLICRDKVSAS